MLCRILHTQHNGAGEHGLEHGLEPVRAMVCSRERCILAMIRHRLVGSLGFVADLPSTARQASAALEWSACARACGGLQLLVAASGERASLHPILIVDGSLLSVPVVLISFRTYFVVLEHLEHQIETCHGQRIIAWTGCELRCATCDVRRSRRVLGSQRRVRIRG